MKVHGQVLEILEKAGIPLNINEINSRSKTNYLGEKELTGWKIRSALQHLRRRGLIETITVEIQKAGWGTPPHRLAKYTYSHKQKERVLRVIKNA
ncbi:MAG TPA: hypothetical protein VGB37_14625 [Candidatus Lokiarchaeia archaeon]